jgi:hypothetical protein
MRNSTLWIAAFLPVCALAACDLTSEPTVSQEARHRRDAGVPVVDAPAPSSGDTVACYSEGSPSATCTLPVHCCFSNYSSQRNGSCTTNACAYGTISCDGPEDCAAGQRCCAHAIEDPTDGTIGYTVACQRACGDEPLDRELCHPATGCSSGAACVTAYGNDNDLPRSLYICE